jgi:alpha-D-ribose 1-methylphosphonate 5-triphosphate synthase subunit PhnL
MSDQPLIVVEDLAKTFTLHNAEDATIPVFGGLGLQVGPGECVVLAGESGVGKSTLMRSIYGNYLPSRGAVRVLHDGAYVDITRAPPHQVLDVRRRTLGYVSQFLRVIPRISTLQLVMEPLLENGVEPEEARARAETLLGALRLPKAHWDLPPATFSGGEQQRVNIARSFIRNYPVLLLDEPTASLDAENRAIVVALIRQALGNGAAMIGIFHDHDVRDAVATSLFSVFEFKAAA